MQKVFPGSKAVSLKVVGPRGQRGNGRRRDPRKGTLLVGPGALFLGRRRVKRGKREGSDGKEIESNSASFHGGLFGRDQA